MDRNTNRSLLAATLMAWFCLDALASAWLPAAEPLAFFENQIRPLLAASCIGCHGPTKQSGGLRLDSREGILAGGDSGPAMVPGNAEQSLLMRAVQRAEDVSAMPPDDAKSLRREQIMALQSWINQGAVWPESHAVVPAAAHWAFAPLRPPQLPTVQDSRWCRTAVDRFVRARQEARGMAPEPNVDRRTLIRRVTFDLTGLPPTPAEVDSFLLDPAPDAYPRLIDRLLSSRAYGERWGRHWLDVVRYADTAGETADYPVPSAWRYRDYVIDAFHADKPYDQFVQEQIAGDILAEQLPSSQYAEQVTATGYLAISRRFGFDSENYHHLTIQDTIDTVGQSLLGLSLGCARCHDHKFDPVTMADYYGLYGIFASTRYPFPGSEQKRQVRTLAPLLPREESLAQWRAYAAEVARLRAELSAASVDASAAVLRSLHDIDGDFELQAVAAGGSNGVLVPPWLYTGKISVTNAAQSPYQNVYAHGKVGVSIGSDAGAYEIRQALYPPLSRESAPHVCLNVDVRCGIASTADFHRLRLVDRQQRAALELILTDTDLLLKADQQLVPIGRLAPDQWQNLQAVLNLREGVVEFAWGAPGNTVRSQLIPLPSDWDGEIVEIVIDNVSSSEAAPQCAAIEWDNLAIQDAPFPPVTRELPAAADGTAANGESVTQLTERLRTVVGEDADLELQEAGEPPQTPWNPGPQSVVRIDPQAQGPFVNHFAPGCQGVHMPNRAAYDGFGRTLTEVSADAQGRLRVAFEFRCGSTEAGGEGTWRYYLGHGPGNSAAVELFFNADELFYKSASDILSAGSLEQDRWYQVRLELDLQARTYEGSLFVHRPEDTPLEICRFAAELAAGWDTIIDYQFIDSYGHRGGARPALDADNFVVRAAPFPPSVHVEAALGDDVSRRREAETLRARLRAAQGATALARERLHALLSDGPFPLAYAMAEGVPHDVAMQLRGEPEQRGAVVRRGTLPVLGGGPLPTATFGSGRRELAAWLTTEAQPLLARVIVNRVWQYHFGRGLVRTPNDFGFRGQPPTHPELLDYLAQELIRSGWSLKAIHRAILLSATYQQACGPLDPRQVVDAEELYAGFALRRLSAEEIRDAILLVSGLLDTRRSGAHPFPSPLTWGFTQHGPYLAVYDHRYRSVYLMTQRLKRHPFLALFDGADPNTSTASRRDTTVPTQALFFLNDPFVHEAANAWSAQLTRSAADNWVEAAFLDSFGRRPSGEERQDAEQFVARYAEAIQASGNASGSSDESATQAGRAAFLRTLLGTNEFLHVE